METKVTEQPLRSVDTTGMIGGRALVQGMRLVATGALVGLAAAVPLMRFLAGQLYGIAPHDVTTLGVSLTGLLVAGGLACDLPARRAAHLDTAAALRSE